VKGAITLKKLFKDDCVSIFLNTSNKEVLKERLLKRNADSNLNERLEKADFEISLKEEFDYEIINDDFYQSFENVKNIIFKELLQIKSKSLIGALEYL
jgi:guanylate kinase